MQTLKIANEKGIGEALKWLSMQSIDKAEIANFSKKLKNAELIKDEKKIIENSIEFLERASA